MGLMVVGKTEPGRVVLETIVATALADLQRSFFALVFEYSLKKGTDMRAIVVTRHGGPEVFEIRELPDPVAADDEVVIRVKAFGLNYATSTCAAASGTSASRCSGSSVPASSRAARSSPARPSSRSLAAWRAIATAATPSWSPFPRPT
jgi:hypothetical protein